MNQDQFDALVRAGYNRIPVSRQALADLDTPLSAYLKLADAPYSYLLESVQGGERWGRYSILGLPARTRLVVRRNAVSVLCDDAVTEETESADPLGFVQDFIGRYRVPDLPGLPRFSGGLVGYFGYDVVRYVERRLQAGWDKPDPLGVPDIHLLLSDELAVFDNLSGRLTFIVYADPAQPDALANAQLRLDALTARLAAPLAEPFSPRGEPAPAVSGFGHEAYCRAVERAKQYIFDGDIMQVVPSQRMSKPLKATPMAVYRALRALNPSPYMYFFNLGDTHIVGASPEILARLEGDKVTVRPIAGTRKRGATPDEDSALAAELLADDKERAEHIMLVDLGRNDLGRVAVTGTVELTDRMVVEKYSHVMHIVSNVEGVLKPGLTAMDVLRATFPAGTVSGAPKVRAMEIIDELEPVKRGIYSGAVGYLGFNGGMDVAIALRTAVIKDGQLHAQAGGGVVMDSTPEGEWQETLNKARAVLRAAELAEEGLAPR
ncbi:MAG: anthranilate synthase component I [Gammaproteobacteria bacterium]|jgi:anthranilate synthase component I|nr:anthranilate synthase component I [Gammaproteobacteria bacterium]MBU0856468.1 anthranilate synthase component I [Gammaproteobacteria bacterium]MBU1847457.1 anthranilate synthase component I [Gammaproteobacteria bacterium]